LHCINKSDNVNVSLEDSDQFKECANVNVVNLQDKRDLYLQVKAYIADYVRQGKYETDGSLPTNREFAEMLKVSPLTIQRAIVALADEGLLYTRRGKGTYVRQGAEATALRMKTGLYACVVPTIRSNTVAATVDALDALIFENSGQHMLLCNSQLDFDREVRLLDSLLDRTVDALIYQSNPLVYQRPIFVQAIDVRLQKFLAAGVPVVLLDEFTRPDRYDTILPDEKLMCGLALRHLLELGHRRFVFVVNPDLWKEKLEAFRKVMAEVGLSAGDIRFVLVKGEGGDDTASDIARGLQTVLDDGWPFTALMAATDGYAVDSCRFLNARGIKCPEDVSIVGADNLEFIEHLEIPLTTVWCEPREVAQRVQQQVQARWAAGGDLRQTPPARIPFAPKLVVRKSTGPAWLKSC
jgi:DNA-binding LacI/PurR family transcriptional regulator